MGKKSINRSIAGFVCDMSYEKLPDSVTHRAKLVALGHIRCDDPRAGHGVPPHCPVVLGPKS